MTWGRVDATPLRLEPLDDGVPLDVAAGDGRHAFTMAPPARRDEVGHALASRAGASLRGRSGAGAGGSTPRRGAAAGGELSEAARKILRERIASEVRWARRRAAHPPHCGALVSL